MPWEVEQKFRVDRFQDVMQALQKLGATLSAPIVQSDHYFNHPSRDFQRTDEAFRLRRQGAANCLTYKGPKVDPETKTRRELELPLPPGETMIEQYRELLEALGFLYVATVGKTRRTASLAWNSRPFEVALDEVPPLGTFVELETAAVDAELDAAQAALAALAQRLGLSHVERRSYLELLLTQPRQ
jgi:adenylate cyclase class 2